MFRRTYQIIGDGRFVEFSSMVISFEKGISVSLIGRESHGAEHTNILGLEYEDKIFPFSLGEHHDTGIKYKNVSACEIYLSAYSRERYENNRASFSIDISNIVFDYEFRNNFSK